MNNQERIESLKNTAVVAEVREYFIELFNERPELQELNISKAALISDMEARFKKKYDAEAIAQLLKNGFEVKAGRYQFKRSDFINELKFREVGV